MTPMRWQEQEGRIFPGMPVEGGWGGDRGRGGEEVGDGDKRESEAEGIM